MASVAFGAADLTVLRRFASAARPSFGAAVMYAPTVFAFVVILVGFFMVRVAMAIASRRESTFAVTDGFQNDEALHAPHECGLGLAREQPDRVEGRIGRQVARDPRHGPADPTRTRARVQSLPADLSRLWSYSAR